MRTPPPAELGPYPALPGRHSSEVHGGMHSARLRNQVFSRPPALATQRLRRRCQVANGLSWSEARFDGATVTLPDAIELTSFAAQLDDVMASIRNANRKGVWMRVPLSQGLTCHPSLREGWPAARRTSASFARWRDARCRDPSASLASTTIHLTQSSQVDSCRSRRRTASDFTTRSARARCFWLGCQRTCLVRCPTLPRTWLASAACASTSGTRCWSCRSGERRRRLPRAAGSCQEDSWIWPRSSTWRWSERCSRRRACGPASSRCSRSATSTAPPSGGTTRTAFASSPRSPPRSALANARSPPPPGCRCPSTTRAPRRPRRGRELRRTSTPSSRGT
mmetsp:Transcript_12463/g.41884  ORF Transcript_12463/g.41884 Transcript_12463/m.41884 type:complete len:337 (+) Transcript_12463:87-1097(+)